jgi:hypothetical protein
MAEAVAVVAVFRRVELEALEDLVAVVQETIKPPALRVLPIPVEVEVEVVITTPVA